MGEESVTASAGRAAGAVEAVLFDAGNTLIYVDPRRLSALFAEAGVDVTVERILEVELEARRRLQSLVARGHSGTEPDVWRAYFGHLFTEAGVPEASMAAVGDGLRRGHREDHLWTWTAEGTDETLARLLERGLRLAVVSNADGRVEAVLERVGLRSRFEFVLDSAVAGVEKPDPVIFLQAAERLGVDPAACLYVGDLLPVDYEGALAAGMRAVLLDPLGVHEDPVPTIRTLAELPGWLDGLG